MRMYTKLILTKIIILVQIFFVGVFSFAYAESTDTLLQSENIFDSISVDIKINGSDGPIEVENGSRIVVSWISEDTTRCRGVWSKSDIKLSGTIAAPSVLDHQPGMVLPQNYPIRTLTLDTLGNTVQATTYDIEKEGTLKEISGGQAIKSWKIKYEKKGHARFVCDPPVLNVSFDKKDSKGNKRELFTGISTYPWWTQMQYQKIRMIPLCEAEQYYNPSNNSYAGFGGKVDAQLREYFTFLTLRSIGAPAVDIVGFANVSFVSPDAQYNGKSFRYMLLQRDNEQDDEFPFTKQFNLEPTLIEDGKYNVSVTNLKTGDTGGYTLLGDLAYTWTKDNLPQSEQLVMRRDPENVLKNLLIAAFVQDGDRSLLHNEDYGKVNGSDIWKTITYGFDYNMYSCRTYDNLFSVKDNMERYINVLPQDQQKIYKDTYYRTARALFSDTGVLQRMHAIVDLFPFPDNGGKKILNNYIDMAFYWMGSLYSSPEFASYSGVSLNPFSPLPFSSTDAFIRAQEILQEGCARGIMPKEIGAKTEVSSAVLKLFSGNDDQVKGGGFGEYLQADFSVTITAPSNSALSISKLGAFIAQLIGPKTTQELASWNGWQKSYERPPELAETVGPSWIIPAGKTARFLVTFKYNLPPEKSDKTVVVDGEKGGIPGGILVEREFGKYVVSLKNITLASGVAPLVPPENKTNTITILKSLSVACSAFSPSLIPTGREVKWVASVEGGTGSYAYSWSGTDGLDGSATTTVKSYTTSGAKTATVVVVSGSESKSASCGGVTVRSAPSSLIQVVAPNGGEVWLIGSTQTIKWVSVGTYVSIELNSSDKTNFGYGLTGAILNDGEEILKIPSDVPTGTYFLKVKCVGDCTPVGQNYTELYNDSNAPITVSAASGNAESNLAGTGIQSNNILEFLRAFLWRR